MSMEYFSISMADVTKNTTALLPLNTPENKRELPCESCSYSSDCEVNKIECVAIRKWYASGDFMDSDMGRLRRRMK